MDTGDTTYEIICVCGMGKFSIGKHIPGRKQAFLCPYCNRILEITFGQTKSMLNVKYQQSEATWHGTKTTYSV